MQVFQNIATSVYSPELYRSISKKSFRKALGYFLLLILLLTFIKTIFSIQPLLFEVPNQLKVFITGIENYYPKDLELKIINGNAVSNVKEPYFIPIPKTNTTKNDPFTNILTIDTKTPYSSTQFENYHTAAWLTKDTLFYRKNNQEISTFSLAQVKNYTLNKDVIHSYITVALPWVSFAGPILLLFAILGFFIMFSLRLVYLLFLALLIWLVTKLFGQKLGYSGSYKVGLYAMTLGLLLETALGVIPMHTFPFMFTLVAIAVVAVNFLNAKKS